MLSTIKTQQHLPRRSLRCGKFAPASFARYAAVFLLSLPVGLPAAFAADLTFNMQLVSQLDPFPGDNRYGDVWGAGNYAYIGSFSGGGVGIIDISNPSAPFLAANYGAAQFKDVKVEDDIGYFANDSGGGVDIVDLSNPASPSLLTQINVGLSGFGSVHNVFSANGFLYEADGRTNTVKVFDVSTPSSPTFVRDIVTSDPVIHDITVVNNRLYTSGLGGTTGIYDVSNIGSSAPTLLGTVASQSRSHSNWVSADGNTLVSARERNDGDVRIFDISNPASPVLAAVLNDDLLGIGAFSPHNPVIVGNMLFTSWYNAGVQVHDISDPYNPVYRGAYDTFAGGNTGTFDGNWGVYPFLGFDKILLSDLDGGLFIVDASATVPVPPAIWLFLSGILLLGSRMKRA